MYMIAISEVCGPWMPRVVVSTTSGRSASESTMESKPVVMAWIQRSRPARRSRRSLNKCPVAMITSASPSRSSASDKSGAVSIVRPGKRSRSLGAK